jgi:tripartite-type tricarboxylate transporter receptor subunit TctC
MCRMRSDSVRWPRMVTGAMVSAVVTVCMVASASAQPYPSRPVRVIVPFSAGGPTDILARLIGQRLYEVMGHQFIIDNRGGTHVGAQVAARAVPDGYTLGEVG